MKIILGDNQFFGINHSDLTKGLNDKKKFTTNNDINNFIQKSLSIGLNGFMINSNITGYQILNNFNFPSEKEIHYSIPYPHKYASMVNENGITSLLAFFLKNTTFSKIINCLPKYIFTRNLKYLIPIATSLEIPKNLPKGSYIYLQNILTDLIIGLKRIDILEYFVKEIRKSGFKPGIITLNPKILNSIIEKSQILNSEDLVLCFNINNAGFNVFPNLTEVKKLASSKKVYKTMGMSIFASGGAQNINESIKFIKSLNLDYVVFGSSKIKNIKSNYDSFVI